MTGDSPPHAARPDHPPAAHRIPEAWDRKPDPFARTQGHTPEPTTALPGEGQAGDRWAAVKSGLLFVLGAALLAWMLISLLL
ncbi:hypothetical protein [Falsiroseomonas sp. CW058]|uniref:hypothetical protein n=1 Tax=Falsiroseomonas sp. CW058 TaxID=3388664 RepID=UPI003D31C3BE